MIQAKFPRDPTDQLLLTEIDQYLYSNPHSALEDTDPGDSLTKLDTMAGLTKSDINSGDNLTKADIVPGASLTMHT